VVGVNLIICSLDTLRADQLSCLGNGRGLTPNLDRIASEGALFSETYATDIPTQPSHTALFTGKFGINSGIVSHFHPAAYLPEETLWLPSLLRRNGHVTGAVDHLFAMKDWFIRGYDDYMPPPGRSRSPGSVINGIGLPWISEHKDRDFFLFLHFWDAHIPYVPPSPYKERYTHDTAGRIDPDIAAKLESRPSYPLFKQNLYDFLDAMPNLDYISDLYDAEVAYLDFEIGCIFEHLEKEGLLEDTMVVLFGDHGENMTEHDAWFDHAGLYDSVTHVPLILWAPGRIPAVESSAMVTLTDVMPTILEAMGLPAADGIDGRSLFPVMRGETGAHRDAVMLSEATWQASRAVRTPEWKYIKFLQSTIYGRDGVELYDVVNDPTEQHNVAADHPEVVDELGARLTHWVSAQLGGRPDPMLSVLDAGLPAVARLNDVIAGQARPRHDVPTPIEPGPSPLAGAGAEPGAGIVAGAAGAGAVVGAAALAADTVHAGNGAGAASGAAVAAGAAAASDHLDPGTATPGAAVGSLAVTPAAGTPAVPGGTAAGSGGTAAGSGGTPAVPDGTTTPPPGAPPGDGGRFAPRNPHRSRLRGARGVVVGALVVGAAVVLGTAVNDLLLSSSLSAAGVVQPTEDAQLNLPTTGTISSISVHVGQVVHAGQVLATQDSSALDARLTADQAKLTADQAMLTQEQAGGQPAQVQQLQDQVAAAQTQLSSAQQKLDGVTASTDAEVAAAQAKIHTDQSLLTSDQQTYQDDIPECTSATPPTSCSSDQRQVQVDQGNLTSDQHALTQAQADQQSQLTTSQAGVDQASAAVTTAQAALTAGSAPGTAEQIASTQAAIQQDQATIAADKGRVAQSVVTAPFDGVVTAINGTVGEVASSQGVRQATSPAALTPSQTTGIQIFPQGPQSGSTNAPTYAALITLDSAQNQMVVQVPETSIGQVHVGQRASATLPAVPGTTLTVEVSQIERTPVTQAGQTYFRVDLVTVARGDHTLAYSPGHSDLTSVPTPGQLAGFTVDVSF
jgi:arylsulfatase A-like enzyme/multidrug efflux pump subunit AcrA (membrane-fusion protein)